MAVIISGIPGVGTIQADNAATESTLQQLVAAVNRATGAQVRSVKGIEGDLKGQSAQAKNTSASMAAMAAAAGGAAASTQGLYSKIVENLQSTTGGFDDVAVQIRMFGSVLADTASGISRTWLRMMGDLSVDPVERGTATIGRALSIATSGLLVFTKGLGAVIPNKVGGAISKTLGLTSKAAGNLAGTLNELIGSELTASIKAFKQFGDMGGTVGGGLSDLRTMAYDSGLTLQQFNSVLKAQREEVISFGGTLADGALKVAKVQNELAANTGTSGKSLQKELLNMGIGLEEQAGIAITVMSQMRALGKTTDARNLNEQKVAKATRAYAEDLRILQEATGKDAKAVMEKARKETMNAALMSKLSVDERANLTKVFAGLEELPADAQADIKQAIMQELSGGVITNPLVASNTELTKFVKDTAARTRQGGENLTAEQLKAGRTLAQTVAAQNKAGVGFGAAAATVALYDKSIGGVVAQNASLASGLEELASRTDPEGITQNQKAIKEATNTQDKLTNQFADLTVEGKRFNTTLGHLNTQILPAYAEAISTVTAGMRGTLQGAQKIIEKPRETAGEIGGAIFQSMLTELKSISASLKPGLNSLLDTIIKWSGIKAEKPPGKAAGGSVYARKPYMVGEIGPELFVPNQSGQIISNQNVVKLQKSLASTFENLFQDQNISKQFETMQKNLVSGADVQQSQTTAAMQQLQSMQASLITTAETQKRQSATPAQAYSIPDQTNSINEAMQNMLQGPYGFATVMDGVKKQLSEDSTKQFSVLQEQIGKLDELVREMRNNTSANENIANMLA